MAISTNVKNTAQSRHVTPIGAYYPVAQSDWGELVTGFGNGNLAYNAGAGSLAMSTARCAITWVTAQGESKISAEGTVSIAAGTGAFTITQPTVPTNGAVVLGWRVYSSSGGAGSALLNVAALSTTQTQSNIVTTQGTLLCFPVATTAVQVLIYGAGQGEPAFDQSGIQYAIPSIGVNTTGTVDVKVPACFSPFRETRVKFPNSLAETAGISMTNVTCLAPLWAASTAFNAGDFIYVQNFLWQCTTAGTTAAANAFPAGFTTQRTLGGTVTDNTATWTLRGNFKIVRIRWMNATGSAAIPINNEFDLVQG